MNPDDVREVRDRQQLRALVEDYARAADRRDADAYAAAFTAEGVLVVGDHEMRGREELLQVVPRLSRYRVTEHLVHHHHLELGGDDDPDTARGEVTGMASHVYEREGVERLHVLHLRYDDRYRRTSDGWRISHRSLVVAFEEDRPLGS